MNKFFFSIKDIFKKSVKELKEKIEILNKPGKNIEELLEELEMLLIQADVGVKTTENLIKKLRDSKKIKDFSTLKEALKQELKNILNIENIPSKDPKVILTVGVNGVGKTTTIAKLAYKFKRENKKVALVAADTFRAAGIEQLKIWGDRIGVEVIKQTPGADPAAVVFDSLNFAQAKNIDILIIDTAGRLHTKKNLMEELKKIKRVIDRKIPLHNQDVFLIIDGTLGQNAVIQAKIFKEAIGITGIILTKLDGTAKGGIIFSIVEEFKVPVRYVGIGEKIEDIKEFNPEEFVEWIFE
jgi:fused signal recognition particle receptor